MSTPEFNRALKNNTTHYNRGYDNRPGNNAPDAVSVGLYTIDNAILKFLQKKIKPVITQDNRQIQVPVIYGNPERWKSVQRDGAIRDSNGKLILPIMMINRTRMQKNNINNPTNKYQQYTFRTGWNSRNVYDKFSVLNRIVPSEMYQSVTIPDFYNISYDGLIWTEYIEQMNKIVENISFESNEYWGEDNNFKFIAKIDQFDQETQLPANNDRLVRNKFTIDVKAYILPDAALNKDGKRQSTTKTLYSPKKVVFDSEIVSKLIP